MILGQKHSIKKQNGSYFLTMTIVGWVDVFTRESYRKIIIETLQYYVRNKGLNIYAYCIMSNHIHIIANVDDAFSLSDVIRDFKKYTSRQIILSIQNDAESRREWMLNYFGHSASIHSKTKHFKVWQDGNHAIELYSEKFTWTKVVYIHQNPVRAGLVSKAENWKYSSASNYMALDSVLPEVYCLKPPLTVI